MQAEQKLYDNGTIWITSVSTWSGKDRLKAEDLDKEPGDILDIIELGRKSLLPGDVMIRMKRPHSQINSLMTAIGAKKFFISGAWWVDNTKMMQVKTGMEKIREDHYAVADDIADHLGDFKNEMIEKYPVLADAKWPTAAQVRARFGVKWHVCEIRGAEINETDPEDLIAAKRQFQEELGNTYQEYSEQIMEQAKDAMMEAIKEISDKIREGQKITETNMKKPRKVVDDYLNIAQIFDLHEVKAEIEKLKAHVDGANARDIRLNWSLAQNFASDIKEMAKTIGNISGFSSDGTVKRVVRKAV